MKRGQGAASGAAVLLAVILGLIIFFIIVIPPADRAEILGEPIPAKINKTTGRVMNASTNELLVTSPGRIDLIRQEEIEHALPAVTLFTRTESAVIETIDSIYVSRSAVSSTQANMSFVLDDLEQTENVLLNFNAQDAQGRLHIELNGNTVFNREVSGNVQPIELSRSSLRERNTLTFSVSGVGAAIWATNRYELSNVQVVADVTSTTAQRAVQVFLMSETEFNNLQEVQVEFLPLCDMPTTGPLTVILNRNEIYRGVPDCNVHKMIIEFAPSLARVGENTIEFFVEDGEYQLSHSIVKSELKSVDFPTYYFELSNEQFGNVTDKVQDVMLRLDFVDIVAAKEGVLLINGRQAGFDTRELFVEFDISNKVVRGNNAIKVKPTRTLEIRELGVWVE
ncbi:MAG: hypothetical protein CMH61_01040 [Nanoarchaeota archaeon]|nr:hypothetical protein [Nanoarchaeota archaeon]